MVFIIFDRFPESRIIEVFDDCGSFENKPFLYSFTFLHISNPNE